jgi:hypothetical protein
MGHKVQNEPLLCAREAGQAHPIRHQLVQVDELPSKVKTQGIEAAEEGERGGRDHSFFLGHLVAAS